MNFGLLSVEEMLPVSAAVLEEEGNAMQILKELPLLEGPVTVIGTSHDTLLRVQQRAGSNQKKVRQLTTRMRELDNKHDNLARGIYRTVEGQEFLAATEERAEVFRELKETLFPHGASVTQRSYREQAGIAKRVEQRLTQEDRDLLAGIEADGTTLLVHVEAWLESAQDIARMEAERAEFTSDDDDATTAGEVRDARNQWIKAMNALMQMLEFVDISDRDRRVLLANMKDATDKATTARRRRLTVNADRNEAGGDVDTDLAEDLEPAAPVVEDSEDSEDSEDQQEPMVTEDQESPQVFDTV